jgi:hypothetical protein
MLHKIIKYSIGVIVIFFFYTCTNQNSNNKSVDDKKNSENTIVKFDTLFHDFGTIYQGESVSYSYKIKNIGNSDLIIKDAISSCGCTVPNYPKKPIKPGGSGSVEVIFDSAGRYGNQYKSVILRLNTLYGEKTLSFKVNIINI